MYSLVRELEKLAMRRIRWLSRITDRSCRGPGGEPPCPWGYVGLGSATVSDDIDEGGVTARHEPIKVGREFLDLPEVYKQEQMRDALSAGAKVRGDRIVDISWPIGGAWTFYPDESDPAAYVTYMSFKTEPIGEGGRSE